MSLTPKQIVAELDNYIVGQTEAKKAVAVALRNRYRRSQLSEEMKEEITPKNIILKGPTGVGKTEIARRLAKLVKAPFIKVEATKFTEVGYVGRDCESMIRDLVEVAVRMVKEEKLEEVQVKAKNIIEKKLVDALIKVKGDESFTLEENRAKLLERYRNGELDNEMIEIEVVDAPKNVEMIAGGVGAEINIGEIFSGMIPGRRKRRKVNLKEAESILIMEESNKLIDLDGVNSEAIKRAEQEGIIFIDEIDKIASKQSARSGQDVSREGVQRDILPFVEGCTVATKYGMMKTDYILFIAAGAFHVSKIGDLIPELQGRFPIRVDLDNLTADDFYKILTIPKNALTLQYECLLSVDNIKLSFEDDALKEISYIAEKENETNENIGARRLQTIMEKILEDISFNASGDHPELEVKISKEFVDKIFSNTIKKYDLNKFVL